MDGIGDICDNCGIAPNAVPNPKVCTDGETLGDICCGRCAAEPGRWSVWRR